MSVPKPTGPDVDIGPPMLALCWSLYSIAGLVVLGRVYTQAKITRQFGNGDIIMICAVAFGFIHIALLTVSHHYGLGRHFFYLDDYLKVKAMEWEFIAEPFGILAGMCGRVAFTILMFQLFGTTKFRRWFLYFLIAETVIINLVTCVTIYTQCEKVETIWDPVGTPSKCWPSAVQADIGYFQGATNSMTDLVLTLFPVTIFFNLQMKLGLKIGLAALLGLSIFALISSIVKTVELRSIGDRADYSYNTVPFMNWVVIENTFVITGASIPLLRPLFNKARREAMSSYRADSTYELGSQNQCSKKIPSSIAQHKSIQLQSSSEENILPIIGGTRLTTTNVESKPNQAYEHDAEKGITMQRTVQVKYGAD